MVVKNNVRFHVFVLMYLWVCEQLFRVFWVYAFEAPSVGLWCLISGALNPANVHGSVLNLELGGRCSTALLFVRGVEN